MLNVFVGDRSQQVVDNLAHIADQSDNSIRLVGSVLSADHLLERFRELAQTTHIDVAMVDMDLPGGEDAVAALVREFPGVGVIASAVADSDETQFQAALRAGASLFLEKPFGVDELVGHLNRAHRLSITQRRARVAALPQRDGRLVVVCSAKGGVGKTTVAVNLAVSLRRLSSKVVTLVDASLQFGDDVLFCKLTEGLNLTDLDEAHPIWNADDVARALVTGPADIRVLPAPSRPELADAITGERFGVLLDHVRTLSDLTIVDCPTWLSDTTLEALERADEIMVVTDLTAPAVRNTQQMVRLLESIGIGLEKLALVVNSAHAPTQVHREEVEGHLKMTATADLPFEPKTAIDASFTGIPFAADGRRGGLANAVQALAQHVLAGLPQPEPDTVPVAAAPAPAPATPGRRRLFGRA
jgi:pilus assembly protein CpaE